MKEARRGGVLGCLKGLLKTFEQRFEEGESWGRLGTSFPGRRDVEGTALVWECTPLWGTALGPVWWGAKSQVYGASSVRRREVLSRGGTRYHWLNWTTLGAVWRISYSKRRGGKEAGGPGSPWLVRVRGDGELELCGTVEVVRSGQILIL